MQYKLLFRLFERLISELFHFAVFLDHVSVFVCSSLIICYVIGFKPLKPSVPPVEHITNEAGTGIMTETQSNLRHAFSLDDWLVSGDFQVPVGCFEVRLLRRQ